jgi:hypothetical protein
MIEADIDATVLYWRRRGLLADVARELHCKRDWTSVRRRMMQWAFVRSEGWI